MKFRLYGIKSSLIPSELFQPKKNNPLSKNEIMVLRYICHKSSGTDYTPSVDDIQENAVGVPSKKDEIKTALKGLADKNILSMRQSMGRVKNEYSFLYKNLKNLSKLYDSDYQVNYNIPAFLLERRKEFTEKEQLFLQFLYAKHYENGKEEFKLTAKQMKEYHIGFATNELGKAIAEMKNNGLFFCKSTKKSNGLLLCQSTNSGYVIELTKNNFGAQRYVAAEDNITANEMAKACMEKNLISAEDQIGEMIYQHWKAERRCRRIEGIRLCFVGGIR